MGKKVLVVDDEKLIVKGIRFSLEQDGMEVDCAYDGEEALECVQNKESPVPFWKTSNKDPCEAVQRLFLGKPVLPATMPCLFLLRLASQYSLQSAQFHVLLPDHHRLPSASRQVLDDAASQHLRKSNSYLNEELSCS